MTVFSTTSEVGQDQLPCQQGNLFFADMSAETQGMVQFSGSVNGQETPVLPVMSQYCLPNTTPGTVRELRFSVQGQSQTVIPDLSEFQISRPEDVKLGLAVETDPIEELPPAPFHPRSSLATAQYARWIFMNEGEIGALRETNPAEWVEMDRAYDQMGFQPEFGKMPLRDASHMIRYLGEIDRRLAVSLEHFDLSPRSAEILTQKTERYRAIVQDEVRRRDNEKGEGVFVIALLDGCPAANMPEGSYTREQATPDQQISLAACISLAFEVAWVDYLEQVRQPENIDAAFDAAISSGMQGAASSAINIGQIGTEFLFDLNESFLRSRSHRTARRMLSAPPPTPREWARMLRLFLREIMSNSFEIRVAPNGTKAVIFDGKASLRAHLTRARYKGDDLKVLDSLARGAAPSWRGAAADALRGGVSRLFIVVAGALEIKTWLESETEDWVDLIVRLGLVIVTAILTAIIAVLIVKASGIIVAGVVLKLVIAGVSIAVGMLVALVFEIARIRQGLAGLIRFAGRPIINALFATWDWVRAAWSAAMSATPGEPAR